MEWVIDANVTEIICCMINSGVTMTEVWHAATTDAPTLHEACCQPLEVAIFESHLMRLWNIQK